MYYHMHSQLASLTDQLQVVFTNMKYCSATSLSLNIIGGEAIDFSKVEIGASIKKNKNKIKTGQCDSINIVHIILVSQF